MSALETRHAGYTAPVIVLCPPPTPPPPKKKRILFLWIGRKRRTWHCLSHLQSLPAHCCSPNFGGISVAISGHLKSGFVTKHKVLPSPSSFEERHIGVFQLCFRTVKNMEQVIQHFERKLFLCTRFGGRVYWVFCVSYCKLNNLFTLHKSRCWK
jgi:hypothetical protein